MKILEKSIRVLVLVFFILPLFLSVTNAHVSENTNEIETVTVSKDNKPLSNASVSAFNQVRTTDTNGIAEFDNVVHGNYSVKIVYNNKEFDQDVDVHDPNLSLTISGEGSDVTKPNPPSNVIFPNKNNKAIYLYILSAFFVILIIAVTLIFLVKKKYLNIKFLSKFNNRYSPKLFGLISFILVLTFISLIVIQTVFVTDIKQIFTLNDKSKAAVNVLSSLPTPVNFQGYGDDRVATLSWDTPTPTSTNIIAIDWRTDSPDGFKNSQDKRNSCLNTTANQQSTTKCIVGYFLRWYDTLGNLIGSKQTIHTITQIQPLTNNTDYIVTVQSVEGYIDPRSYAEPIAYDGTVDGDFAIADGNLSAPIQLTVRPTSNRVDAMRQRLTGFFDDFNTPSGDFDETKWNNAYTGCTELNEAGQFVNSQFHVHNQIRSSCDRAGSVARPRAIFDTTGRTEQNPGQIEFDIDGATQPRDVWYLDLIPEDARKSKMPIDVTSHNDLFGQDNLDPGRMIRLFQSPGGLEVHFYNEVDNSNFTAWSGQNILQGTGCPDWAGNGVNFDYCDISKIPTTDFSAGINIPLHNLKPVPNVRRHWVVQYSSTKMKIFIDNKLILNVNVPSLFSNINRFQVESTTFSYNTGKQYNVVKPTTSMIHWDNFGFNGPATNTVTHNYLEGGQNGDTPYIAKGTNNVTVPQAPRNTRINIPDAIGSPTQARLMFTLQAFGYQTYHWSSNDNVVINGVKYPFPNPVNDMYYVDSFRASGSIDDTITPMSTGILVKPQDLKSGLNDISLNIGNGDANPINVHMELDYTKGSEPTFTQPKNIFANMSSYVIPSMRTGDMYWFIEQDMGINKYLAGNTTTPTPSTTTSVVTTKPTSTTAVPTTTPVITTKPPVTTTIVPTTTTVVPTTSLPQTSDYFLSQYFNNTNLSGSPALTRLETAINLNIGTNSPAIGINADKFSIRWTKAVNLTSGIYQFNLKTDDGMRVFIDNNKVFDKWFDQAATNYSFTQSIASGTHIIVIEYYDNTANSVASFNFTKL